SPPDADPPSPPPLSRTTRATEANTRATTASTTPNQTPPDSPVPVGAPALGGRCGVPDSSTVPLPPLFEGVIVSTRAPFQLSPSSGGTLREPRLPAPPAGRRRRRRGVAC